MKKITFYIIAICTIVAFQPIEIKANTNSDSTIVVVSKPPSSPSEDVLILRLNEINDMDKSDLKSSEKKALRKEVRSIKQQLTDGGGGIYISAGAVVIIVLLLIILL
ncbi:MAG: hypothetical protein A2W98_03905 [Bacteroidetes bacterium GWF2_33_38]|nr:MAG: hypothetical protein A2W98_03905 [Bacteroidetes bacterium GWF2_33_38]OFY76200.1 MAG: hypothetical protein A2265_10730 [Bacteroidetes bacterium RIFOXYA12_FULL_33_9]OFY92105.1 MAG: hypothetical protein A2236_07600 [Bacteroidetes bacterium RIFOXYA2_FULL_33_7]